jgi:hypothetical protein
MSKKPKEYKKDYVTVYTDASWNVDHGSWAFWVKSDHGRLVLSGVLPKEIENIFQGEVYTICQAVYKALKQWPTTKGFYIRSDNRDAMSFLKDKYVEKRRSGKPHHEVSLRLKRSFDKMVLDPQDNKKHILELFFKHVKGHQNPNRSVQFWLNNWCDKEARKVRLKHNPKVKSQA